MTFKILYFYPEDKRCPEDVTLTWFERRNAEEVMCFICPPVQNMLFWEASVNIKEMEKILGLYKEQR